MMIMMMVECDDDDDGGECDESELQSEAWTSR
jgi:hypothetical protein